MTESTRDGHASHSLHGGVYPGNLFMVVAPSGAGKST
ncbi:guanylate kinase, partial [Burkholderia sp. TJI49]